MREEISKTHPENQQIEEHEDFEALRLRVIKI